MKKLFIMAIVAAASILAFPSCKKSSNGTYTCTCTYKGSSTGADTTIKPFIPAAPRKV